MVTVRRPPVAFIRTERGLTGGVRGARQFDIRHLTRLSLLWFVPQVLQVQAVSSAGERWLGCVGDFGGCCWSEGGSLIRPGWPFAGGRQPAFCQGFRNCHALATRSVPSFWFSASFDHLVIQVIFVISPMYAS